MLVGASAVGAIGTICALALLFFHMDTTILTNPIAVVAPTSFPASKDVAIWIWKSPEEFSPQEASTTLDQLKEEGFDRIYLEIDGYQKASSSGSAGATAFARSLSAFVTAASARGLAVEGLGGDIDWAQKENRSIPVNLLAFALAYNKTEPKEAQLSGMQFDIEAYSLASFADESEQAPILTDYLSLADELATQVKNSASDFRLEFAIPFWFDNQTRVLPPITLNGSQKPVGEHLIDILSGIPGGYVAIMDYRNTPEGDNGAIARALPLLSYASQAGSTKVVIGLETNNVEPASITFFSKTKKDLYAVMQEIYDSFKGYRSFEGFAVHDEKGFDQLAP